ncbi:unnamed protein product [Spirodela intermedia]|uniref:Uncharacterized protein n=1 Tax=Spirodela intermedia TaxID=51605 RepID=A0A7I8J919_SPIIN|nr:unnamed protein product [Spirodela intermedia]CAA6666285.1 unnamed protein product [Spirodela intermedia]
MEQLIPGLPDEIARECLIRLPYGWWHAAAASASSGARRSSRRTSTASAGPPASPSPWSPSPSRRPSPSPATQPRSAPLGRPIGCPLGTGIGNLEHPPPVPGLPRGLPLFCQLAAAGRRLVVIGGWNPESWVATDEVHVYDFMAGSWRRGAPMPGPRRSFFACASDGRRMVFVAGGHDEDKNALRSAMAYDVERDEWLPLPDMARERDECKGCSGEGASTSSEAFDVAAWRWGPVEEDALEAAACPRTCVAWGDGRMYRCRVGNVAVMAEEKGAWRQVAELPRMPASRRKSAWHRARWRCPGAADGGGSACHGGPHSCYILEPADGKRPRPWRRAAAPEEYSGHVQASCCLQI